MVKALAFRLRVRGNLSMIEKGEFLITFVLRDDGNHSSVRRNCSEEVESFDSTKVTSHRERGFDGTELVQSVEHVIQ